MAARGRVAAGAGAPGESRADALYERLDGQSQLVFPDGRVEDGGTSTPKPVRAHTPQAPCRLLSRTTRRTTSDAVLRRNQRRLVRAEALTEATNAALDASGFERGEAVDKLLALANERPATPFKEGRGVPALRRALGDRRAVAAA